MPCRNAAKALVRTHQKFADKGVVFVGLTAEGADELEKSRAFVADLNIPWTNGYGAGQTIQALGVTGYPTTFVIGPDGRVRWNDELEGGVNQAIEAALAELAP